MTPKEKSEELIKKYSPLVTTWDCYNDSPVPEEEVLADCKKCALIAAEEIINLMVDTFKWDKESNGNIHYWQEVKLELENL